MSFSAAIREGRERVIDAKGFGNRHFSYVERGFYEAQLLRTLNLFPAANVLLLDSRKLSRNPESLVTQAARFLGLEAPIGAIEPVHANKRSEFKGSETVEADDVALFAGLFASDVAALAKRVDLSLENWPVSRLAQDKVTAGEVASRLVEPGFADE